jgi:glutamate transport system substrate-binding protein
MLRFSEEGTNDPMIKRVSAGVAALMLALAMAACGGDDDDSAGAGGTKNFPSGSTMAKLNQAQKITIGTKFDQPLFGLQGLGGKPEGFDVEIGKIIVAELGIPEDKIQWIETPSRIREEAIEQGRVDMVAATYTINDERKQRVTFAGPYYVAGQLIMVKSDNNTINGPESLRPANAKVCSVEGSTPAENIKQYIDEANLVTFDVYSKCADALRAGQVDAVTTDNVILLGLVSQSEDAFKLVGEPFTEEPYGIGIKRGDVEFCNFINQTLQKASQDGRYEKAWKETAGTVAEDTPSLPQLDTCT